VAAVAAKAVEIESGGARGLVLGAVDAVQMAINALCGLKKPADLSRHAVTHKCGVAAGPVAPLPAEYDSRTLGIVPPIRDQGQCGQCWNFAPVSAHEVSYCKRTGANPATVDFSEQSVVDCGRTGGCDGDWPTTSAQIQHDHGVVDERADPYRADSGNGRCQVGVHFIQDSGYLADNPDSVTPPDAIKAQIVKEGSAVVNMYVDQGFAGLKGSGVYKTTRRYTNPDGTPAVNHSVTAVAWSESRRAWLIRNHWTTQWGDQGYGWLDYDSCNVGYGSIGVTAKVDAPQPNPGPGPNPPTPAPGGAYAFSGSLGAGGIITGTMTPANHAPG